MKNIRVRFAPSPTGALHIGGIRTALYNYILAKKHGGTFILRIEDTDQNRYVAGAENYIVEALKWCGIEPQEGPNIGGKYGPYRQSERKSLYGKYAQQLVDRGNAYYAFDTDEELQKIRAEYEAEKKVFKYDHNIRRQMNNSLEMSKKEIEERLSSGEPYTVRLKVPVNEIVNISDLVRGQVQFQSNELDDKIMMKSDGMPTYHLANIVDDHLMKITHVIRGEEWLPSTAHHVLLYRALGWEDTMPQFAHLPLILKPTGKGKLSKRDGAKLGIPVFPLSWNGETAEDSFVGFREFGFDPRAVVNFLAFLGWNPGTEQELFSLDELCQAFDVEKIGKSGARFDFDKAKWFNQQYIMSSDNKDLAAAVTPLVKAAGYEADAAFLEPFVGLLKERVTFITDFVNDGYYFFEPIKEYEQKMIRKKWKPENRATFEDLAVQINGIDDFSTENLTTTIKSWITEKELGFGAVLPILRLGTTGTMKGPDVFAAMALLGKEKVVKRLNNAYDYFDEVKQNA